MNFKILNRIYPVVKRCIDILIASFMLLVLSPLIAVTAVAVRMNLGSPVLFCQQRPGLHGQAFTLLKFRSMRVAVPGEEDSVASDEIRLTPFGRLLRASSLDELPSLWNVLKGDMSLIGPRPLMMEYLPLYSAEQKRRHEVRPGVTGLAQVNGRNGISWEKKFEFDVYYVDHMSLLLDVKIVMKTISVVLRKEGIEHAPVAENGTVAFTGSPPQSTETDTVSTCSVRDIA